MRASTFLAATVMAVVATSLAGAQAPEGRGVLVDGWTARLDPGAEKQGKTLGDTKLWSRGASLHVAAGPSAAFWQPDRTARGTYTVSATFAAQVAPPDRDTFGLFIGGSDLSGRVPNYLYCTLHGTGLFSVLHRFGDERHSLVERRESGAIHPPDAAGRVTNQVAWRVSAERVECLLNGTAVASFPRSMLIGDGKLASTDGAFGLYVGDALAVEVTGFTLVADDPSSRR